MKGVSLRDKITIAIRGIAGVLKYPRYVVFSGVMAVLFASLVYLIINAGSYGSLLMSRLPLLDKLQVVWMMLQHMMFDMVTTFNGVLLLLVSLLQGLSFSVMLYTFRRNRQFSSMQVVGSGGIAAVAAALGLGCVPCGTSIILPIVSVVFSSSAYAAASIASAVVLVVAFGVTLYSLYKLGMVASAHIESEKLRKANMGAEAVSG